MKSWICFLMLVLIFVVVGVVGIDLGTHNHFVNKEGGLLRVQDYRCPGRGHICETIKHDCDGEFNVIETK